MLNESDHPHIAASDGRGRAYCRHHGEVMKRVGFHFFGTDRRLQHGLQPGVAVPGGSEFRVRYECPVPGCPSAGKKPGLHMRLDWSALSGFPPQSMVAVPPIVTPSRLALYARRNSCEALFGAMKLGHKTGNDGAERNHTAPPVASSHPGCAHS